MKRRFAACLAYVLANLLLATLAVQAAGPTSYGGNLVPYNNNTQTLGRADRVYSVAYVASLVGLTGTVSTSGNVNVTGTANVTGAATLNAATLNTTATLNATIFGVQSVNDTNTTLLTTCPSRVSLTNITAARAITVNATTPAGKEITLFDETGVINGTRQLGVGGNVTLNVTGGGFINGLNNVTWTNVTTASLQSRVTLRSVDGAGNFVAY